MNDITPFEFLEQYLKESLDETKFVADSRSENTLWLCKLFKAKHLHRIDTRHPKYRNALTLYMNHIVQVDHPNLPNDMRRYMHYARSGKYAKDITMEYIQLFVRVGIAALLEYMEVTIDIYHFDEQQRTEESIATTILNKYNEITHNKSTLHSLRDVIEYENQIVPVIKYHMERRVFLNNIYFIDRMHDHSLAVVGRSPQSEVFGDPNLTGMIRRFAPRSTW